MSQFNPFKPLVGVFIAVGIVAALVLIRRERKQQAVEFETVVTNAPAATRSWRHADLNMMADSFENVIRRLESTPQQEQILEQFLARLKSEAAEEQVRKKP